MRREHFILPRNSQRHVDPKVATDVLVKVEPEDPSALALKAGPSSVGVDEWWKIFEVADLRDS